MSAKRPRSPATTAIFSRLWELRPSGARSSPAGAVGHAPDEGEIGALQRAGAAVIGELRREALMGAVVLGDHQEAGRVLVEPMHDARPLHAADAGEAVAAMGDERVDQRAGLVARRPGWTTRPGGLVDDDEVVVLVDDGERDRLAPAASRRPAAGTSSATSAPARDLRAGIAHRDAVDGDAALPDQRLQAAARKIAPEPRASARSSRVGLSIVDPRCASRRFGHSSHRPSACRRAPASSLQGLMASRQARYTSAFSLASSLRLAV